MSCAVNKINSFDYLFAAFFINVKSLKVKRLNIQKNIHCNKEKKARKENL